ncbi:MAG: hypothetical protein ACK4P8_02365 [Tabrizicola sp.]
MPCADPGAHFLALACPAAVYLETATKSILAVLALGFATLGAAPTIAQDSPGKSPVKTAEAKCTLTIATALLSGGRANRDPLALLSAVQMMVKAAEGTTIEFGGKSMDLGVVLDEAVAMAPGDPLIVARADALHDEAETRPRGPAIGNTVADGTALVRLLMIPYPMHCMRPAGKLAGLSMPHGNNFPSRAQKFVQVRRISAQGRYDRDKVPLRGRTWGDVPRVLMVRSRPWDPSRCQQ